MQQIDNVLSNRQLYKKSYLIEFYEDDNVLSEVFTFSVPPESEELTYSQRKTETKTFGGLHVDEYGTDAVKVSLSGSTINQSLKRIYRGGNKSDDFLSGEEEIYKFRDLVQTYKEITYLTKHPKAKVYIYDLSKFTGIRGSENIKNYWQAFLGDFKIRRSNDRPFTYKYTLEFTGVNITQIKPAKMPMGSEPLGFIKKTMDALKDAVSFIYGIEVKVNDVLGYVDQVSELMKTLGDVMSGSVNSLLGIIDSAGSSAEGLINGATATINGVNSIVSMPLAIKSKVLNLGLKIQGATNGLVQATANLTQNCRSAFSKEYAQIPPEVLDQYATNNEEFQDSINKLLMRAENAANELAAKGKSSDIPEITLGNADPETGDVKIIITWGHTYIMIDDTDSLESLAAKYLGDPDRAIEIATYNGVRSLEDLEPGAVILIPITTRTPEITDNLIYSLREDRDNYGRDILLTDKGSFVLSSTGDYELIDKENNLAQAVLLRLRESVNKRIRVVAYGIRTNISDPTAGVAYIISSIDLTVNNDPRVSSVENINFKGEGDSLNVNVVYKDINSASGSAAGRV